MRVTRRVWPCTQLSHERYVCMRLALAVAKRSHRARESDERMALSAASPCSTSCVLGRFVRQSVRSTVLE